MATNGVQVLWQSRLTGRSEVSVTVTGGWEADVCETGSAIMGPQHLRWLNYW